MKEIFTQRQFLESYANGRREFTDCLMQFFDISNIQFSGLTIKDSKLMFCTFRNCDFNGAKFENCEIYWGSFYNNSIKQTIFINCKMELTLFDSTQFDKTSMQKCNIRICGILNCNLPGVDLSSSIQDRLITDISQVTQKVLEETISETSEAIGRLDVSTRMKIMDMVRSDTQRYGIDMPEEKKDSAYASKNNIDAPLTYGEVRSMVEAAFGVYGTSPTYKTKRTAYETKGIYKK